jgi:phosphatidylglycerophosphatase A
MSRLIASFFGVGFFPVAAGTAGSAVALVIGAALMRGPAWLLPAGAVIAAIAGFLAIRRAVTDPEADPGWVVIDEVAGQWIAMLGLTGVSLGGLVAAFVGFRVLDVLKPGPIGWADRQSGAFGIMADDVLAGGGVALMLYAVRFVIASWQGGPMR